MKTIYTLFTLFISITAFAGEEQMHMPAPATNKNFEQLKQLVGKWEGKTRKGDKEQDVTVTYELTSGGNAILEKLFVGTPHEMISVYYPKGRSVAMTHYCMFPNTPEMSLKKADPNLLAFEMKGTAGIHSAKEMHMHALNIKWDNKNSITEEWVSYNDGKQKDTAVFRLSKQ